jgi:hypothetical protein
MDQNLPAGFLLKTTRYGPAEGISGLYVELKHVLDMGQKSDRQKVAMRPNGWLYKVILLLICPF